MGWVSEQMTVKYRIVPVTLILLLAIANILEIYVIISGGGRGRFSRSYTCCIDYCNAGDHHHHHLALQPFVGFCLLSQVFPSSSVLSYFLPVFDFQLF
jgi:hypothetical protein